MRDPDFVIGGRDNPYMMRWYVIPRNRWFNVYYHVFLRSDDDRALHDHPWLSLSFILKGGYYDLTAGPDGTLERRFYGVGSVLFRWAASTHRVELLVKDGRPVPAATLFVTGPKIREWGFHCPRGWVHWRAFTTKGGSEVGRGCG